MKRGEKPSRTRTDYDHRPSIAAVAVGRRLGCLRLDSLALHTHLQVDMIHHTPAAVDTAAHHSHTGHIGFSHMHFACHSATHQLGLMVFFGRKIVNYNLLKILRESAEIFKFLFI